MDARPVTTRQPLSRACHVSHPTLSQAQLLESCLINIFVWVSKLRALIVGICCHNAIVMSRCNYSIKIHLNRINRDHETHFSLAILLLARVSRDNLTSAPCRDLPGRAPRSQLKTVACANMLNPQLGLLTGAAQLTNCTQLESRVETGAGGKNPAYGLWLYMLA